MVLTFSLVLSITYLLTLALCLTLPVMEKSKNVILRFQ